VSDGRRDYLAPVEYPAFKPKPLVYTPIELAFSYAVKATRVDREWWDAMQYGAGKVGLAELNQMHDQAKALFMSARTQCRAAGLESMFVPVWIGDQGSFGL
jgi:hypothetical protein